MATVGLISASIPSTLCPKGMKKMFAAILKSLMHYIYVFDIKYLNFPPFSAFEDVLAV